MTQSPTVAPGVEQQSMLTDEQYQEILRPVLSRKGMQCYLNGDAITLDPSDYRAIINRASAAAIAAYLASQSQAAQPSGNPRDWLIDGSLLYRLNDEGDRNADEINITMANGSRNQDAREAAAAGLMNIICVSDLAHLAVQSQAAPVAYVNGDELDNMLDDRTAIIQSNPSGWRKTALYLAAPVAEAVPEGMETVYLVWYDTQASWIDAGLAEYEAAEKCDRRIAYEYKKGERA